LTLQLFAGKLPEGFGLVSVDIPIFIGMQKSLFASHYKHFDLKHFH
jgi:hypothetical protein